MGSCLARTVYLTTLLLGRLSTLKRLTSLVYRNWQLPFSNQQKEKNRKYFMINLHERILPTRRVSNRQSPDHQSDMHPIEPSRLAIHMKCQDLFSMRFFVLFFKLSSTAVVTGALRCPNPHTLYDNNNSATWYSESSLQRLHLFPKTLPLKWICYCTEYLMSRLICKKGFVSFLFPKRTCSEYLLESPHWGYSNKYPKHMFL